MAIACVADAVVVAALLIGVGCGAAAAPIGAEGQAICAAVDRAAIANRLSAGFLTRVLWQESRFRSDALSSKGAQGVAQFMPPTALERGLANPWDPGPAIAAAGRLLADLKARFGNVGLAAAAYNAGPARVDKWLHAESGLPIETRAYVRIVTGREIQEWVGDAEPGTPEPGAADCLTTVAQLSRGAPNLPLAGSVASPLDRVLAHALSLAESQPR